MSINQYVQNEQKYYEVYVNGFDSRGRRVQRRKCGIDTLRKAQLVEFELKRELAKLREEAVSWLWFEWFAECLKRMKVIHSPSTVENYEKVLKKWVCIRWDSLPLQNISKNMVHSLIYQEIDQRLTPNTKRTILKMIRRVFQMAVEEGLINRNPCAGIQVRVPETDSKVLSSAETEIFLKEARRTGHRFFPIWFVALATGCRSGELMALRWTDVDFGGLTLIVSKQWTSKAGFTPTKTQKARVVPISEDLARFLKELKLKEGSKNEFVLPHMPEWLNGEQARITREFCTSVGITPVKFHDLRATFITNLLSRGVPLAQVMAIVGHSQLKTTNCYLRKAGVEVKGVTDRLSYKLPEEAQNAEVIPFSRER
jgi:integrase